MIAALATLATAEGLHPFTFDVIDVDADPALVEKYDERVPVLVHDGEEVCHYFLDRDAVSRVVFAT